MHVWLTSTLHRAACLPNTPRNAWLLSRAEDRKKLLKKRTQNPNQAQRRSVRFSRAASPAALCPRAQIAQIELHFPKTHYFG